MKTTGVTIDTGWQAYTTAQVTGGFTLLYDSGYLSTTQASLDTGSTGFATSFTHLLVRLIARGDNAANNVGAHTTFNGDAGSNYSQVDVTAASTTTTNETYTGTSPSTTPQAYISSPIPAANALASWYGLVEMSLPYYSGMAIKAYTITRLGGPNLYASTGGGYWNNTAAISRIQVTPVSGNFAAGTRLMVYAYN